jgi:hypothetical protein
LKAEGIHLVGLVLNRVHVWPGAGTAPADDAAEAERAIAWLSAALEAQAPTLDAAGSARALVAATRAQAALARRDAGVLARLEAALPLERDAIRVIPLFSEDVHELEALARMADLIFAGAPRA